MVKIIHINISDILYKIKISSLEILNLVRKIKDYKIDTDEELYNAINSIEESAITIRDLI